MIDITGYKLSIGDLIVYSVNNKLFYGLIIANTQVFTLNNNFVDFDFTKQLLGEMISVQKSKVVCRVNINNEFVIKVYEYLKSAYMEYVKVEEEKKIKKKEFEENIRCGDIISFDTSYYIYLGYSSTSIKKKVYMSGVNKLSPYFEEMIYTKKTSYAYLKIPVCLHDKLMKKKESYLNYDDFRECLESQYIYKNSTLIRLNKPTSKSKQFYKHYDILLNKIDDLEIAVDDGMYQNKYIFNCEFLK